MTPREPDEFDLELELAGVPVDPEAARALADPSLDPARAEIEALRVWWALHRPPLPVRAPGASPRSQAWRWATPLVALAAVALVMVAWPRDPGFHARGVPAVDLWRTRDGAPIESTAPFEGGDQLGMALVLDQDRYVSVVTLQDDGRVSPLVVAREVRSGARFQLPGRIALDDYTGREWLVVLAGTRRMDPDQLTTEVDALLPTPEPGPGRWVVEVTRGR